MKKLTDLEIEQLWKQLGNVAITENGEMINEDFHIWRKLTNLQDVIYQWFDDNHSKNLYWLVHELE